MTKDLLYRGWSGAIARNLVQVVGVGPLEALAAKILAENLKPTEDALRWLADKLSESNPTGRLVGFRVHDSEIDNLAVVMNGRPALLPNGLETVEHIVYEEVIQSPCAARTIDSLSENPMTAVMYAYDVNVDAYCDTGSISPANQQFNKDAFVAIVRREPYDKRPVIREGNIMGKMGPLDVVANKRAERDKEILHRGVRAALHIEKLPPLSTKASNAELRSAEKCIISAASKVQ